MYSEHHHKALCQREVKQLLKKQKELYLQKWNLGLIELETPIRHGWYKEFTINNKIERYKHKKYIEELCSKLEKCIWGRTQEEAERKWMEQTSKHLLYKDIPTLSPKTYRKLSDPAKRMCVKFRFREYKKWRTRYYIKLPNAIVNIKFSKAYITHRKRIDPNIESEIDWISCRLKNHKLIKTYRKAIAYNRWKWLKNDHKYRRKKLKRDLKQMVKELTSDFQEEFKD